MDRVINLNVVTGEDGSIEKLKFDTKAAEFTFDDLVAILFCLLQGITEEFIKETKSTTEQKEYLYDMFGLLFDRFLERVFPEVSEPEFDLSDAAILYAQDKIIEDAAKNGITFNEAMKHFEEEAKRYVLDRKYS